MKIPQCELASSQSYRSKMTQAVKTDRATIKGVDDDEIQRARAKIFNGVTKPPDHVSVNEQDKATMHCLAEFQDWFKGRVIRRTVLSKDPSGKPTWGAEPPVEKMITLNLMKHERDVIENQAATFLKDRDLGWQHVSNFPRFIPIPTRSATREGRQTVMLATSAVGLSNSDALLSPTTARSVRQPRTSLLLEGTKTCVCVIQTHPSQV